MRYYRGISQVNIYWNAIACHLVLQLKYLLRYCIVVCCIFYQLILHNIWYYKSLGIIWYCLLNIYLHIIIIYIYIYIYVYIQIYIVWKHLAFYIVGISCGVIANHSWSFNRILWHVTWYCNFNVYWSTKLYYILITWHHSGYCMILF